MPRYWLMKSEPSAYSIDDLKRDGVTAWTGIRNYQARNLLRDEIKAGDGVLFYASSAEPTGVTGLAVVTKAGFPDPTALKPGQGFDAKSDAGTPTWYAVEIRFVEKFAKVLTLQQMKEEDDLARMMVVKKGSRLSIQPVTDDEWCTVLRLAGSKNLV